MNKKRLSRIPHSSNDLDRLRKEVDEETGKPNQDYPIYCFSQKEVILPERIGDSISAIGRVDAIQKGTALIRVEKFCLCVEDSNQRLRAGDIVHVQGQVSQISTECLFITNVSLTRVVPCKENWPPRDLQPFQLSSLHASLNEERRRKFSVRAKGMKAARSFFGARGYTEIDTPIIRTREDSNFNPTFRIRTQNLKEDLVLRTSPEDFLRRTTIVFPRVFEIGKSFRNEKPTKNHLSEFTQIEFYEAYSNLENAIQLVEALIKAIIEDCGIPQSVRFRGNEINLLGKWNIYALEDAFSQFCGFRTSDWPLPDSLKTGSRTDRINYFEHIIQDKIAPNLIQPTILRDFPIDTTLLPDKVAPSKPGIKLKAELYIGGIEIGEIGVLNNDPEYLFLHNLWCISSRVHPLSHVVDRLDWDWLKEFEYGIPPVSGGGIGYDRLIQVLTGTEDIKEIVWYPYVRDNENSPA